MHLLIININTWQNHFIVFFGGNLCVELLVIQALGMLPKYCGKDGGDLNTEDRTPLVWLYVASMARQE